MSESKNDKEGCIPVGCIYNPYVFIHLKDGNWLLTSKGNILRKKYYGDIYKTKQEVIEAMPEGAICIELVEGDEDTINEFGKEMVKELLSGVASMAAQPMLMGKPDKPNEFGQSI